MKTTNKLVILVDKNDKAIGTEEKIKAHQDNKLHRAFSILITNSQGKILLQKRAENKYHSGSLWTNTCCSHPRPGEETETAAHRRLQEEMGFDCPLKEIFSFVYQVNFEKDNLSEHEFDHVFIGTYDKKPKPNPEEVEDFKWISPEELIADIKQNPESYSFWFKNSLEKILKYLKI